MSGVQAIGLALELVGLGMAFQVRTPARFATFAGWCLGAGLAVVLSPYF